MTCQPLLLVDGNSLLHRSYHAMAGTNLRRGDGHPSWAIKGFWNLLAAACDRVDAAGATIAFDTGQSVRHNVYPQYKAGRADKPQDLTAQLAAAPTHLRACGFQVVTEPGYEADDILAAVAARNLAQNVPTVIVTSDRDAFSLITDEGAGVRVLRVINGGADNWALLNSERLHILTGVYPHEYRTYAAIRGDSSDNLPGVKGIGEKTAAKLLAFLRERKLTLTDVLDDPNGANTLVAAVGKGAAAKFDATGRDNFRRNMVLMAQDEHAPSDTIDGAFFPLPAAALDQQLREWNLTVNTSTYRQADTQHAPAPAWMPTPDAVGTATLF